MASLHKKISYNIYTNISGQNHENQEVKIEMGKGQNSSWSYVARVTFFADFPKSVAREVEPVSACMFYIFAFFSLFIFACFT